jgi:hypothetical protein
MIAPCSAPARGSTLPGRPEESHLQPPTEPCVNLSIYTARPSHCPAVSRQQSTPKANAPPDFSVGAAVLELGHPLRSTLVTSASSLLPDDPPPSCTSVLSPFVFRTYRVFPSHCMKSSQVPCPSLDQSHATYTPDTTWPISRHPPCFSWERFAPPVLMSPEFLSMRRQWLTFVRLSDPYMTCLSHAF